MAMLPQLALYFASFLGIWLGSGLVLGSVGELAHRLRLPSFTLSFFMLGLLTSLPELVIGLAAIADGRPEIFVGNLIGGVIVMFLLVIPLLSMATGGIGVPKSLSKRLLLFILVICFVPSLLTGDQRVDNWEGILAIALYLVLFLFFSRQQKIIERLVAVIRRKRSKNSWIDGLKILGGVGLLVVSSQQIIDSTMYFADILKIAPFFVSLIVVSLGTNLPELSLVVRMFVSKKKDDGIALADYLGSASANTLFFGVFALMYPAMISIPNNFFHRFLFIFVGLAAFYLFLHSEKRLTRTEGAILLLIYIGFVIMEFRLAG